MKLLSKICLVIVGVLFISTIAVSATLGEVADNIFVGADFFTKFLWAACILVGIFLLVGFLVNYQAHRNNPKLVPLATVITYLVLGLLTISIPFLNKFFGTDSYDAAQHLDSN